jgi:hypothetical protein
LCDDPLVGQVWPKHFPLCVGEKVFQLTKEKEKCNVENIQLILQLILSSLATLLSHIEYLLPTSKGQDLTQLLHRRSN